MNLYNSIVCVFTIIFLFSGILCKYDPSNDPGYFIIEDVHVHNMPFISRTPHKHGFTKSFSDKVDYSTFHLVGLPYRDFFINGESKPAEKELSFLPGGIDEHDMIEDWSGPKGFTKRFWVHNRNQNNVISGDLTFSFIYSSDLKKNQYIADIKFEIEDYHGLFGYSMSAIHRLEDVRWEEYYGDTKSLKTTWLVELIFKNPSQSLRQTIKIEAFGRLGHFNVELM
eukprot:TRINITY_DN661_c0_g1_i1.p1 TRINITY_DN661_c0_g1~~TRINITY_DN661_c0_g1_i1.p1  ORF type:complete len:225 (+),score=50.12 TRINITY_DN661_c0_g1_i1:61-735(+)